MINTSWAQPLHLLPFPEFGSSSPIQTHPLRHRRCSSFPLQPFETHWLGKDLQFWKQTRILHVKCLKIFPRDNPSNHQPNAVEKLICDPNIYALAEPVPYLTFEDPAELAYFGAQILTLKISAKKLGASYSLEFWNANPN
ncbi:hypothetical protein LOK49_LG05G01801 [Camellia lanceoleosa]|uniref:Uncharacterized protein n=1 Tax=Camellia lanceoleosa TaxID=1840588 RepID=A0ACC0HP08_9ERIC|nr:hypothetical protein LOK49_LG05G01801 [Camellia lanceoleosa]